MDAGQQEVLSLYYLRSDLYRKTQEVCGRDLTFYKAVALFCEGHYAYRPREREAISLMESVLDSGVRDWSFPAASALSYFHQRVQNPDHDCIRKFETQSQQEYNSATDQAKVSAGFFYLFMKDFGNAKKISNSLSTNSQTVTFLCWIKFYECVGGGKKTGQLPQQNSKEVFNQINKLLEDHLGLRDTTNSSSTSQEPTRLMMPQLDACMLKAKICEVSKNWIGGLENLNHVIVYFPWYTPAIVEKAKLQVASGDWQEASETTVKLDEIMGSQNLDSIKITLVHLMTRGRRNPNQGGNLTEDIARNLEQIFQILQQKEPYNGLILIENVQLFSRLCGGVKRLLHICKQALQSFVDTVLSSDSPNNSFYYTELGNQHLLMGDVSKARELFQLAQQHQHQLQGSFSHSEGDEESAMYGFIYCRILEGEIEEAGEQLEFLKEVHHQKSSRSFYLSSLIARNRGAKAQALQLLNETLTMHISEFRGSVGYEFYKNLNPEYMMRIASEYIRAYHEPAIDQPELGPGHQTQQQPNTKTSLSRAIQVLETLGKFLPGNLSAQTMLGRAKLWNGAYDESVRILEQCLVIDPGHAPSYLLMARVYFERDDVNTSLKILEQGLSRDFSIRNHPLYHLIKAKVIQQDKEAAIKILESCMTIPGVKKVEQQTPQTYSMSDDSLSLVTIEDRVNIYLLLVQLYAKSNRMDEASALLEEASLEFKGSADEVKVLISQADLHVERGDIDKALTLLNSNKMKVSSNSNTNKILKQKAADIYLKHRSDPQGFARCYKEIVEADPDNLNNYIIYGDALLEICDPSGAIQAFEKALNLAATDGRLVNQLVRKIGGALVLTHDYESARSYYTNALKRDPGAVELRLDLSELHSRLENWSSAIKELENALEIIPVDSPTNIKKKIEILKSLARVHLDASARAQNQSQQMEGTPVPIAAEKLRTALQLQKDLLNNLGMIGMSGGSEVELKEGRQKCAELSYMLADYYYKRERNSEQAVQFYNEVLDQYNDAHEESILSLSKIYMAEGQYELCERQLLVLLRMDSETAVEASTLMAELLMILAANGSRSEGGIQEYRDATYHYRQLLEKKPSDWSALSRLVYLLKRGGKLKEFEKYLKVAEKHCGTTTTVELNPGFRFCRGMYYRALNRSSDALVDLNFARTRDADFRKEATLTMIDIYLFPDPNSRISLEALQDLSGDSSHSDHHYRDVATEVDLLINELFKMSAESAGGGYGGDHARRSSSFSQQNLIPRLRVYQAQNAIFTKRKTEVDRGLQQLMDLYNEDRNYVPALLAMSQGLIISKQVTKARGQLKRIAELARKSYNPDYSEDFEKGWLLLSDIYISNSKFELASTLCHLASTHNRSSGKAWENLGLIYEKEHAYMDAAVHYERAWTLSNQSSPQVGFRLAFNHLKSKRLTECILICRQVLKINPNYPKIQKEILEKARAQIRI